MNGRHLGTIFILRKGVLRLFSNHPPTYVRTFSLHKVRENSNFLDHPPTPMSLRNIKMAPNMTFAAEEFPVVFYIGLNLGKVLKSCRCTYLTQVELDLFAYLLQGVPSIGTHQESRREGWTDARLAVGFCLGSGLFGSYKSD